MTVVISCYEVPATAEPPVQPAPGRAVHRAVGADAPFGYISVETAEVLPESTAPVRSGRYEVIHEGHAAAAAYGSADPEPLIFINCMEFPPGREQEAFDFWLRVNEYMVRKPGYRSHRLHRRLDPSAPFGQINVVEWESVEAWDAAHDDGFRALTVRPDIPFRPVATLTRALSAPVGT